jgi:hypothetical protein
MRSFDGDARCPSFVDGDDWTGGTELESTDRMTRVHWMFVAGMLFASLPAGVLAQERPEPVGPFALDLRVALPRFPDTQAIADALVVTKENLPGRGLGLSAGVHVYPFRLGKVAVGLGGELLVGQASRTLKPVLDADPDGPTVTGRITSISPQLSLNFGSRRGGSYVSAGLGFATFTVENEAAPVEAPDGRMRALNYGGGARWFAKPHLAFTFDLRFHRYDAQAAITGRPAYPAGRMMVASVGISVK